MQFRKTIIISIIFTIFICCACKENVKYREYTEIESLTQNINPNQPFNHPAMGAALPESFKSETSKFLWDTPKGWKMEKGSGMRTATFYPDENDSTIQCVVVELQGDAGGLKNNIIRWMKQLKMIVPGDKKLTDFISRQETFQTKGGFSGVLIDMTTILSGKITDDTSGLVGVVTAGEQTLYVRMFSSTPVLLKNKGKLLNLCKSFRKEM